jgi:hypothetical protein
MPNGPTPKKATATTTTPPSRPPQAQAEPDHNDAKPRRNHDHDWSIPHAIALGERLRAGDKVQTFELTKVCMDPGCKAIETWQLSYILLN